MPAMNLNDIPLFAMLRGQLGYLSERQRLIAENVANANSPGYAPHDLQHPDFQAQLRSASGGLVAAGVQAMTQPGHMQAVNARGGPTAGMKTYKSKDSETTLDGNSVVLEEEMMKMTESRMNYDAAVSFYQHSLNLLQMAIRKPGG